MANGIASTRLPVATYRLQLHAGFTFADAQRLVSYLRALGVSDLYLSPCFKARPGSPHGYDVIDHNAFNPELGTEQDFTALAEALRRHGMGQLLDIVPNYMGVITANEWWNDVLENGPNSPFAAFFDIDWTPIKPELANKVVLPLLGNRFGTVLENQELRLTYDSGSFHIRFYDHQLPLFPQSYAEILGHRLIELEGQLGVDHPDFLEWQDLIDVFSHLPLAPSNVAMKQSAKARLKALTSRNHAIADFLAQTVRSLNGTRGMPRSFDPLQELLDKQAYRLTHWRDTEETNYRNIGELAAVRAENPVVFAVTHQLVLHLLSAGQISGVRVDSTDYLHHPAQYLRRFHQAASIARQTTLSATELEPAHLVTLLESGPEPDPVDLPCYVVVDKILQPEETLPEDWLAHGTTGYDALHLLNGICIEEENEPTLTGIYTQFTEDKNTFSDVLYNSKKVMEDLWPAEVNALAHQLYRLSDKNRYARDFTLTSLTRALREIIACFPVHRTYVDERHVTTQDRRIIETAVDRAKAKNPHDAPLVYDYIRDVLLLHHAAPSGQEERTAQHLFVVRFQQLTESVGAIGGENTAFYRYTRLASLNELGTRPDTFGVSLAVFHARNQERAQQWPHSLVSTSTHDSLRSEDVRARLNVISELPDAWRGALHRWRSMNEPKKTILHDRSAPDGNEEYLLYQTLLGVWPLMPMTAPDHEVFNARVQMYMQKASREARVNSSWHNPNEAYEIALTKFVSDTLADARFLQDFQTLQSSIAHYGMYNALSQTVLKLTVPGVPDIYQGNEIWDFSLVDPDNRRPVDYDRRMQMLDELRHRIHASGNTLVALARQLLADWRDGQIKLYVTHLTLSCRHTFPRLFTHGAYLPIYASGTKSKRVCAFARCHGGDAVLVIVPRLLAGLLPDAHVMPLGKRLWRSTWLPIPAEVSARRYRNIFTGETCTAVRRKNQVAVAIGEALASFPVALLVPE